MSNCQLEKELAHLERVISGIRNFEALPASYWRQRLQAAAQAEGLTRSQCQHVRRLQAQLASLERRLGKSKPDWSICRESAHSLLNIERDSFSDLFDLIEHAVAPPT